MIFTKWFGMLGITYIVMSFIDFKSDWVDKIYFKIWGEEPPPKEIYWRVGLMSIICGLLLDFLVWLYFIK
jgi:hypothetical protein